jgi:DNA-directed RNA polymerase specialized sigma24 family protein
MAMARIESIKHRLENWSRWHIKRESGALGYPSRSSITRLMPPAGLSEAVIPVDDCEASETDQAIQSLRRVKQHLHDVLMAYYIDNRPIKDVAQRLGKAESSIKANLAEADHAIQQWLVDKHAARRA